MRYKFDVGDKVEIDGMGDSLDGKVGRVNERKFIIFSPSYRIFWPQKCYVVGIESISSFEEEIRHNSGATDSVTREFRTYWENLRIPERKLMPYKDDDRGGGGDDDYIPELPPIPTGRGTVPSRGLDPVLV